MDSDVVNNVYCQCLCQFYSAVRKLLMVIDIFLMITETMWNKTAYQYNRKCWHI